MENSVEVTKDEVVISRDYLVDLYKEVSQEKKAFLEEMYGREIFFPDVRDRIKTFADACRELGHNHPFVMAWNSIYQGCEDWSMDSDIADVIAYHKLRIITVALNEGWKPKFIREEKRWYVRFGFLTYEESIKDNPYPLYCFDNYQGEWEGFSTYPISASSGFTSISHRLCYKSEALADYSGRQFADLWADFYLIRK